MCICCTEDKKGGVDRSSTVIAKEPEGKPILETEKRFDVSTSFLLCITRTRARARARTHTHTHTHTIGVYIRIYVSIVHYFVNVA